MTNSPAPRALAAARRDAAPLLAAWAAANARVVANYARPANAPTFDDAALFDALAAGRALRAFAAARAAELAPSSRAAQIAFADVVLAPWARLEAHARRAFVRSLAA